MATAIEGRSSCTGGHMGRVTQMATVPADMVIRCDRGPLAWVSFGEGAFHELRVVAWLHDIGETTKRESAVNKPEKASAVYHRIGLLRMRFACIRESLECFPGGELYAGLEASTARLNRGRENGC